MRAETWEAHLLFDLLHSLDHELHCLKLAFHFILIDVLILYNTCIFVCVLRIFRAFICLFWCMYVHKLHTIADRYRIVHYECASLSLTTCQTVCSTLTSQLYVCMHVCMHACTYTYDTGHWLRHSCTSIRMHVQVTSLAYIYIYIHVHTYIHT